MGKVKLIVHETYQGNCKREDVFAAVFFVKCCSKDDEQAGESISIETKK